MRTDNFRYCDPKATAILKCLYDETSPERMKLEEGFRRIFSTQELIDGAYKQAGKEIGK